MDQRHGTAVEGDETTERPSVVFSEMFASRVASRVARTSVFEVRGFVPE